MFFHSYKTVLFYLFITFPLISFAQDGSPFNMSGPQATPESVLLEILKYPTEAAQAEIEGRAVYKIKIDESGKIEGFTSVEEGNPFFQMESLKAINYLKANWYLELMGTKPNGKDYLLVMSFSIVDSRTDPEEKLEQVKKWIEKDKSKKALKTLDQLIKKYPYEKDYFQLRGQVFAEMTREKESQKDLEKASELESLILAHTVTLIFGSSRIPISF